MCKEIFLYFLKRSLHYASGSYWYACLLLHQELRLGCLLQVALAEPGMKHMGSREIHPEALPPAAPLSCPRPAAGEEGYRCPHSLWKEAPSSLVLILPAGSGLRSASAEPPTQLCDYKLHVYPHGFLFLPQFLKIGTDRLTESRFGTFKGKHMGKNY